MHPSSMESMKAFVDKYLDPTKQLRILDIGSYDVNGSYKHLFSNPKWDYVGGDIEDGPNVDMVFNDPYHWNIPPDSFDVIISGQCIEHVEDVKEWIKPLKSILKRN